MLRKSDYFDFFYIYEAVLASRKDDRDITHICVAEDSDVSQLHKYQKIYFHLQMRSVLKNLNAVLNIEKVSSDNT